MTVEELPEYRKQQGLEIGEQLRNGTYQPWRLAHSPALTLALPNAYFAQLGLPPMVVRS
jgi:RNA-directed DNA polymerase